MLPIEMGKWGFLSKLSEYLDVVLTLLKSQRESAVIHGKIFLMCFSLRLKDTLFGIIKNELYYWNLLFDLTSMFIHKYYIIVIENMHSTTFTIT